MDDALDGFRSIGIEASGEVGDDFDLDRRTLLNNIKTVFKVITWIPVIVARAASEAPVPV
jgi:hypothetical protein